MRYCKQCILPDTRSNVSLNKDGVCVACENHERKKSIDWNQRNRDFREIVSHAKSVSQGYDCIIPVSGGKDSTWQVICCLEYGLKPLAVTWKPPFRTEIGRKNLQNLINLGVDHIDYQISPKVERKFMLEAFRKYGSTGIPMHMALFNIPLKLAVKFDIPVVVWGENSAFEYGSKDKSIEGYRMDRKWLKDFGVTHGTTAEDWVSETLSRQELTPYFGPNETEFEQKKILAVFLGHFFEWDPIKTFEVSKAHGFQADSDGPKTGYYDFADIDDDFISIHHYLKWFKFGFTRTFDNLSIEIRHGRLSRNEAIELVRRAGIQTPDKDIEKFCKFVGITRNEFDLICESFRNQKIWKRTDGRWVIEDFLIPDWKWQ